MTGTIRGLKGKEMRLLSDRRKARSGELFDDLLHACWLQVDDPGPYRLDASGSPTWLDVLSGDRFHILIQLRQATYPEELYSFPTQCTAPACGEPFQWEVSLDELPVRMLSEDSLRRFKEGIPFEATMDDTLVKFELSIGRHERKGAKFAKGNNADVMRVLAQRIVSVDGVDQKELVAWLDDRELSEHRDLLQAMDAVDCGVETAIEVQCPECGNIQKESLPFGPAFFMPVQRAKKE